MRGLAVALGGIVVSATLAIGLSSTASGATGRFHHTAAAANPQSMSNATTTSAGYVGCSASQQQQVSSAANVAQKLAGDAAAYLAAHTSATPRFTTWFGSYTPARRSTVLSHFRSISQTQFATLTYDCTCQQPGAGSVDPADHVVLCQGFWHAPATGTDSQAGTLVNLVGRFSKNGGLNDSVQGQSGCQALAKNNPAASVQNAASHEYFAENNPPLA